MTSSVMELNRLMTALLLANYLINQVCCMGTFQVLIYGLSSSSSSFSSSSSSSCFSSDQRGFLVFRVCLSHFQVRVAADRCTYGEGFSSPSQRITESSPAAINISISFSWPGSYSLVIEAKCNSADVTATATSVSIATSVNETLLRMLDRGDLSPLDQWKNRSYDESGSGVRLDYGLRFVCDPNLFGPDCSTFCHPRDDARGHYTCSPGDGSKVCADGWTGPDSYCNTAVCRGDCNHGNGTCVSPNKCSCFPGWTGSFCDTCVKASNCSIVHGTCQLPGECNCDTGWGGLYCDQDLQFCANNDPCQNGGTCLNSEPGGFECECPPGFTGSTCQDVCPLSLCYNGATCIRMADGQYSCNCPSGYTGENCQWEIDNCQSNPCLNGGKCVNDSKDIHCLCAAGFSGLLCEQKLDECPSNPCRNGATCYEAGNAGEFLCLCSPEFTGNLCDYVINGANQSANATHDDASALRQYVVVVCLGVLIPCVVIATMIVIWLVVLKLNRRRCQQSSSSTSNGGADGDNIRNDLKSLNNYNQNSVSYHVPVACTPRLKITNITDDNSYCFSGEKVIAHARDVESELSSVDRKKYGDANFKQLEWTGKYEEWEKNVSSEKEKGSVVVYSVDKSMDRFVSLSKSTCPVEDNSASPHRFHRCFEKTCFESYVNDIDPAPPSSSVSLYATPCVTPSEECPVTPHKVLDQASQYSTLV